MGPSSLLIARAMNVLRFTVVVATTITTMITIMTMTMITIMTITATVTTMTTEVLTATIQATENRSRWT